MAKKSPCYTMWHESGIKFRSRIRVRLRTQDRVCNTLQKEIGTTLLYPIQFIRDLCNIYNISEQFNATIKDLLLRVKLFDCKGDVIPVAVIESVCISSDDLSFKALANGEWRDVYYKLDGNLQPFHEKAISNITIEHCEGMQKKLDELAMSSVKETPLHLVNQLLGVRTHFRTKTDYDIYRRKVIESLIRGNLKFPDAFDHRFFQDLLQQVLDINGEDLTLLPRKHNHI